MKYLGFDLGASSGKMMLGSFDGEKIQTEIVHRFPNRQSLVSGGLYWNILDIYQNLKTGIERVADNNEKLSLGVDSFCNDFGLLDRQGRLLNQVFCYRDERTKRNEEEIYSKVSREALYMRTGCQTALFNTVIQMAAMVEEENAWMLEQCSHALLIPDLLIYFLTGEMCTEYTLASVSQMFNYKKQAWDIPVLDRLGIRPDIFPDVVPTGHIVGRLSKSQVPDIADRDIQVVSVCEHDTASAIAALPTEKEHVAYISSGTWSIMGTEVPEPILTEEAFQYNIAYEGGIDYRYRMIKNIMGLWVLQECQRDFERKTKYECSHEFVLKEAEKAEGLKYLIDPDEDIFYMPGNMIEKVIQYCESTGQGKPETFGEVVRTVLESLAMKYRYVLDRLEKILGYSLDEVYILGGGGKNRMLDQFTANACRKKVYAGPDEAALAGNILVQMRSMGDIASLKEGRQIIKNSFAVTSFEPEENEKWENAYMKFKKMIEKSMEVSK